MSWLTTLKKPATRWRLRLLHESPEIRSRLHARNRGQSQEQYERELYAGVYRPLLDYAADAAVHAREAGVGGVANRRGPAGRRQIATFEQMLELNPYDNLGTRDPLLGLYPATNQPEPASELSARFPDEERIMGPFAWARVLERWLSDCGVPYLWLGESAALWRTL